MWASGDYPKMVETFLTPLGPRLVDACGIGPATACSTSRPAPATPRSPPPGAAQTSWPATSRPSCSRPAGACRPGLDIEWATADAERLPFESGSFDVVMSSIGVMFAPYHQAAADELVRVCRPGGTIGLLCWTPEGMLGALFRTMKPRGGAAAGCAVAAAMGQ